MVAGNCFPNFPCAGKIGGGPRSTCDSGKWHRGLDTLTLCTQNEMRFGRDELLERFRNVCGSHLEQTAVS
jgi:hypothetical protein